MKKSMVMVLGAVALAGAAQAAEINYKNGAWQWNADAWEGGEKPGPSDTAVIPELPVLKTRFDAGKMQSNGLQADEEIFALHFKDLYGINVNGGSRTLTLQNIICDDVYPTAEDTAQIATNRLSMTTLTFKGAENKIAVGNNHVLLLDMPTINRAEGSVLVKTGPGTVIHGGQSWGGTVAPVWVKEGLYVRPGNGYPEFRGDVIIGGADKSATLTVLPSAQQAFLLADKVLDIRANGRLNLPDLDKYYYLETLKIDHGVLDGGGSTMFCMSNQGTTECGTEYTFDGGVITNGGIVVVWQGVLTIKPSDKPSAIYGRMVFNTGYDVEVQDGTAPVDFIVDGSFEASNRGVNKAGAGTMVLRSKTDIEDWGGIAGKPFAVKAGALFYESSETTGTGMGTNNVEVAAGATYGAVGRHIGAYINLRGDIGKVILNGEADKTTTFVIGRIDETTGALKPGQYTIGEGEIVGGVEFKNEGVLQIAADKTGVSKLVVNGAFTSSGNDTLDIVGPVNSYGLEPGTYEIVKTSEAMNTTFKAITYNGGALPKNLKVTSTDKLITMRVAPKGLAIVIR
ncbi:MAG: hypothetical protein ACI4TC_04065 [Kiritimatiellia bacterium]